MWLMFNKMADDEPFKLRTKQTVVSLLDHFRAPAPKGLSRSLPVLKCTVNKADFLWNCLEFCCMLYKNILS